MMMSEFIERVGFEPTAAEYHEIEAEYMGCDVDKDKFCKDWKKNGGIQRLCRLRVRRIEELENEVKLKDRQFEEMDARHCRSFNELNDRMKKKVAEFEEKVAAYEKLTEERYNETEEVKKKLEEAEGQIATVRAAFAILGIGKEEA